jgi:hypothetical protein
MVAKGKAKELKRAAQAGTLTNALARLPPAELDHGKKVTVLILETLPPTPESPTPVTYLSAGEIVLTLPMSWIEKIIIPVIPVALRHHRLNPQQAAAVCRLL